MNLRTSTALLAPQNCACECVEYKAAMDLTVESVPGVLTEFPRGGSIGKPRIKRRINEDDDSMLFGANVRTSMHKPLSKMKKKRNKKHKQNTSLQSNDSPNAETLHINNLSIGMHVLGVVQKVTEIGVTLVLANAVRAYVSISEVSDKLATEVLHAAEDEFQEISSCLLKEGDVVRGVVLSFGDSVEGVKRKRPLLTLRPSFVNAHLQIKQRLKEGTSVWGEVTSIEEHGSIVTFGVEGPIRGFLKDTSLPIGTTTEFVCKKSLRGQVVQLELREKHTINAYDTFSQIQVGDVVSIKSTDSFKRMMDGHLVDAGALIGFGDGYTGYASMLHWFPGQTKALILYVDYSCHRIGVTTNPNVVDCRFEVRIHRGMILKSLVEKVAVKEGVYVRSTFEDSEFAAFAKLKEVDSLHGLSKGEDVRVRVLGVDFLDGLINVSLRDSVLTEKYFLMSDLAIGQKFSGAVKHVTKTGLLVEVSPSVLGFVPNRHLVDNDSLLVKDDIPHNYPIGKKLHMRVLDINTEKQLLVLSLKSKLVRSTLSPLTISNWEDLVKNELSSTGFVTGIKPFGLFVTFCSEITGLVPRDDLCSSGFVGELSDFFKVGECIDVRIIGSIAHSSEKPKLKLSVRKSTVSGNNTNPEIFPGSVVSGKVLKFTSQGVLIEILLNDTVAASGFIPTMHLSEFPSRFGADLIPYLSQAWKTGTILRNIAIVERSNSSSWVCSMKRLLIASAKNDSAVRSVVDCKVGDVVVGVISNISAEFGIFVKFFDSFSALLPITNTGMDASDMSDTFNIGDSLVCMVDEVNSNKHRVYLSFESNDLMSSTFCGYNLVSEFSATYFNEKNLVEHPFRVDALHYGFVSEFTVSSIVKGTGFFIDLSKYGNHLEGFVYMEDTSTEIVGSSLLLRVLDFNSSANCIEFGRADKDSRSPTSTSLNRLLETSLPVSAVIERLTEDYAIVRIPEYDNCVAFVCLKSWSSDFMPMIDSTNVLVTVISGSKLSERCLVQLSLPSESLKLEASPMVANDAHTITNSTRAVTVLSVQSEGLLVQFVNSAERVFVPIDRLSADVVVGHTPLTSFTVGMTLPSVSIINGVGSIISAYSPVSITEGVQFIGFVLSVSDKLCISLPSFLEIPRAVNVCHASLHGLRESNLIGHLESPQTLVGKAVRCVVDFVSLKYVSVSIQAETDVSKGDWVMSKVVSFTKHGLVVRIANKRNAFVHFLDTQWQTSTNVCNIGDFVWARITEASSNKKIIASLCANDYTPMDAVVGLPVSVCICSVSKEHGIFVYLSKDTIGLIKLNHIPDDVLSSPDWTGRYLPGTSMSATIVSADVDNKKIHLSLLDRSKTVAIEVGSTFSGTIVGVQKFGVFVRIPSGKSGLVHRSEMPISHSTVLTDVYSEGSIVGVRVLSIDEVSGKISLSMQGEFESHPQSSVSEMVDDSDESIVMETFTDDEQNSCEDPMVVDIEWDTDQPDTSPDSIVCPADTTNDAVENQEFGLKELEKKLCNEVVESVADMERLIMADPDSSVLWIQYIAMYVNQKELEKARTIAKRAINTINFRQQAEKLSVWIAWLNLENLLGSSSSLESLFKEALRCNDPKTIYMRMTEIFEQTSKLDLATQHVQTLVNKFSTDISVWCFAGSFFFRNNMLAKGRALLKPATQALIGKEKVTVVTKFALLEFHNEHHERGRTLFEGLLDNYPKRTDIWSMYLDQELRLGNSNSIRQLFARIITLTFKPQKMKLFFKRYLAYEQEFGDEESVAAVKHAAREFVEQQINQQ